MSADSASTDDWLEQRHWVIQAWCRGTVVVVSALVTSGVIIYTFESVPHRYLEYALIGLIGGVILPIMVGWILTGERTW